ncbi:FkbM family methyltransferase [Nocardioides sp. SYSU DS0651]|uniref:FkbM family methyltransferase n=1 Tax=Nocardioides sp. SYSU DS0651 TaxID=3415955 RepID=UPI003F4C7765
MPAVRSAAHLAKRIRQTPALFRNFPTVFWDLGTQETRLARREMTLRLRNGFVVTIPNADGARYPVYEIFADDAYGMADLTRGVDADAAVLDIGGQVGCFALAVARALPAASIDVYEASPTSAAYARRNMADNALADRVTVHAAALAGERGEFSLVDNGTASVLNGITAPEGSGQEVVVPAVTFDDAVAEVRAAGRSVQVVKMDVEGAEYDVVLASSPKSWSEVRTAALEYHPVDGHGLQELLDFLAPLGLRPYHHEEGNQPGLGMVWLRRGA